MTRDQLIEKRRRKKRNKLIIRCAGAAAAAALVFFAVRAITKIGSGGGGASGGGGKRPEGTESVLEPVTVDTDTAAKAALPADMTGEAGWNVDDSGWWFLNPDGTIFVNGWKTIDDRQYYFKDNGYMATGWYNTGGIKDSYFDESGALDTSKQQKLIALTYDDGPSAKTEDLLNSLQKFGAKGTFFLVGQQAEYYDEFVKREAELGMELGNHSYDHPWLSKLDADGISYQLNKLDSIVEGIVGFGTKIMRPTGGGMSVTLINTVTKPMIQWDVDTLDWDHLDAAKTTARIQELSKDGSVVLMHDLFAPAADAADDYLAYLRSEGFKMVTVSQLAEAYGYDLEAGGQYYAFYPGGNDMNMSKQQGIDADGKTPWD